MAPRNVKEDGTKKYKRRWQAPRNIKEDGTKKYKRRWHKEI